MPLSDSLQKHKEGKRPGFRCGLCRYLDSANREDYTALMDALNDDTFTGAAISRALNEEGIRVSTNTVQRHRAANHVVKREFEETSARKSRRETQKGKSS